MFTLLKKNQINASIPGQGSLTDSIHIHKEGNIKDIKISVNIPHPYIKDISIKITAPSGKEVSLKEKEGENKEGSFHGEILQDFIGEQAQGAWTITATGPANKDKGTLDSWSIELDCEEFKNEPTEIFIPEVEKEEVLLSTQDCRFDGRLTQAAVDVEIQHPLIGDLIVSIISPDGNEVALHDRVGGSQKYLKNHWNQESLDGLVGSQTKGIWTLKIKNFHSSNEGTLKYWKVKFHYEAEDDLKIIEGIGPKIEELLKKAGIYSYLTLATTSPDRIKEILSAAGDRFNMHDPATWPKQSSLAAQGKWEELNMLKEVLDGGRAVE